MQLRRRASGKAQKKRLHVQAGRWESAHASFSGLPLFSFRLLLQQLSVKLGFFGVAGSITSHYTCPCDRKCRHLDLACSQIKYITFESRLLVILAWLGLPTACFFCLRLLPSSSSMCGAPRTSRAVCCVQTFRLELGKKAESSTVAVLTGLCDLVSG